MWNTGISQEISGSREIKMSFSNELKKELCAAEDTPRHCRLAFLSAAVLFLAEEKEEEGICFRASNEGVLASVSQLMKKLFGTRIPEIEKIQGARRYELKITDAELCGELKKSLKCRQSGGCEILPDTEKLLIKNCCKRAFLRGAFLCAGTISDPDRSYHMEINCRNREQARIVEEAFRSLSVEAHTAKRNRYDSVYIKDGNMISDALGLLGARVGLLEMENRRIVRSMRGSINRKVNCETANIGKAAAASARQIEDIRLIMESGNASLLAAGLDEVARIRLEYPEATLSELAERMDPPIGKSGINHRLRKISSIAAKLREESLL